MGYVGEVNGDRNPPEKKGSASARLEKILGYGRFQKQQGPNSIEGKWLEFWLEIPYTKKMFKRYYSRLDLG